MNNIGDASLEGKLKKLIARARVAADGNYGEMRIGRQSSSLRTEWSGREKAT